MNQEAAFKMYFGLNLHFTQLTYSVLTYGTNTKSAQSKYDSLSNEQKYRFEWLSRKYPQTQDLVYACIGSLFDSVSVQFGTKDDIVTSYFKFKSRRESINHVLKSEIIKHEIAGNIPLDKLIVKHFIGEYCPEYILLLTHGTDELNTLYDNPNFSWAKEKILKLMKYDPFFNAKKYLPLLENK